LTLIGRVETIRMNILPRQSISPAPSLKCWIKLCLSFKTKKHELNIKAIGQEQGRFKLIGSRELYWAAQLRALILWITMDRHAVSVEMEQRACPKVSLESLPFITKEVQKKMKIQNY